MITCNWKKHRAIRWLISTIIFGCICLQPILCDDTSKSNYEPPFPQLFSPSLIASRKVHIVSEIVSDESGYQTIDEYIDLSLGKQSIVTSKKDGHDTLLVDASTGLSHLYRPFTCQSIFSKDMKLNGLDDWRTLVRVGSSPTGQPKDLYLYGVSGLWMFADEQSKVYTHGNITYSAAKDIYRTTNTWTVEDEDRKLMIQLNFVDANFGQKKNPDSMISSIVISSSESERVLRTYNILSADYSIEDEVYENLLQIPVGYGCQVPARNSDDSNGSRRPGKVTPFDTYAGSKLDLEITATKFEYSNGATPVSSITKRTSDTFNLEMAFKNIHADDNIQLVRKRSSKSDIKRIINYKFNTQYTIDLRAGVCDISHADSDALKLKFANGMNLNLQGDILKGILSDSSNAVNIERISSNSMVLYEEQKIDLFGNDYTRLIRTYLNYRLSSVVIWVLDPSFSKIVESYHINIIGMRDIQKTLELARIFDVSEECYLNNDKMEAGRDYAWLEFTYDVMSRDLNEIVASKDRIKAHVLNSWFTDFFRTPRIELMMNDDGFMLRMLLIDIPPIEAVFDQVTGRIQAQDATYVGLSPDLSHCASLCRLFDCYTMTFFQSINQCLVSNKVGSELKLVPTPSDTDCKTYTVMDSSRANYLYGNSIHDIIGKLQSIDFSDIPILKMPDELTYPMSFTGIDQETYMSISESYAKKFNKYIEEVQHIPSSIGIMMQLNQHVALFLPRKFEVESDPLDSFNLKDNLKLTPDSDSKLPPFHEGLSSSRYKTQAFDKELMASTRILMGLSYDQCALACVDTGCSSFSHCSHELECVITSVSSTAQAMQGGLIDQDPFCFIAQRDFIGNFNKFPNVVRPAVYAKTAPAHTASECAFNCVSDTQGKCLSFTFCTAIDSNENTGTCLFQDTRYFQSQTLKGKARNSSALIDGVDQKTGCDHYIRSYLADFYRVARREIDPNAMANLKTTIYEGKSVFDCADICVNEVTECSAFQFCLSPIAEGGNMQKCTLIEALADGSSSGDLTVLENKNGEIIKEGKLVQISANCQLFSLRPDTSEAHLRQSTLGVNISDGIDKNSSKKSDKGLSIGSAILLFSVTSIVFIGVGVALSIARERNDIVRRQFERFPFLSRY